MIRRIFLTAAFAFVLGGCATDSVYHDGSYGGHYDGGYYSAPADGYGDYYYDRPQVVVDGYPDYFYGPYAGYGFGYASWGFGYNPWFYRPWWVYGYHPWWGDHDHDGDDWWRHHHHHWSGQGPWPHTVSAGHAPRGGVSRGDSDRHPPTRWMPRPKP
jgi:hypothetical protein